MSVLSPGIGGTERATVGGGRPGKLARGAHGPFSTFWSMLAGGGTATPPRGGAVSPLTELDEVEGGRGCGTGAFSLETMLGILLEGEEDRILLRCRRRYLRSWSTLARMRSRILI